MAVGGWQADPTRSPSRENKSYAGFGVHYIRWNPRLPPAGPRAARLAAMLLGTPGPCVLLCLDHRGAAGMTRALGLCRG